MTHLLVLHTFVIHENSNLLYNNQNQQLDYKK